MSDWFDGGYGGQRVRVLDDGHVEVEDHGVPRRALPTEKSWAFPTYGSEPASPRGIEQHRTLINKHALLHLAPAALIAATIGAESLGQMNAYGTDPGGGHGFGLMQLTSAAARMGYSDDQLLHDADANINAGTSYLKRQLDMNKGNIVRAVAAYNAGSARQSSKNQWNLVMADDYVGTVLALYNAAVDAGFAPVGQLPVPVPPPVVVIGTTVALLAFAAGAGISWWAVSAYERRRGSLLFSPSAARRTSRGAQRRL